MTASVRFLARKRTKKTHASYMPAPTMFRGRTMPAGPPVPSLLGCSLCSARALPFCRAKDGDLGEIRDISGGS